MNEKSKLGRLVESNEWRDAIHIAIVPVVADTRLSPGQDVGVVDGNRVGKSENPVGIIDPFLKDSVKPEQSCWMLLYPNTITSLRHEWTHPAFPSAPTPVSVESKAWLEHYASSIGVGVDELIERATYFLDDGSYWGNGDRFDGVYLEDEFWPHYQAVTGRVVSDEQRGSFFSCSC